MVYYKMLNIVPCAIQYGLVIYFIYSDNPRLLIYPSYLSLFVTINLFSMSVSLFLFCK